MTHKRKSPSIGNILLPVLLVLFAVAAALAAGAVAFWAARQVALEWPGSGGLVGPQIAEGTRTPALNAEGTPLPPSAGPGSEAPLATLTPWDGVGRVNVLLLGLDYRDWEASEDASRSDTMILLSLDPQARTAGILSIPRDLWVAVPGFKHSKINMAYYMGDAYKLPGGGPALAAKTVEELLGVPIHYYAQVDFAAFVRFIDEIGGVAIDVPAPITVDLLGKGAKTKKKLQPGKQVLPGEWALAYARNRYTENGDFDRAARQQQVIMGIRNRILSFDLLPTLIAKAPQLYQELSSGVRTNLTLDEVLQLALIAQTVPEESIKRGIINKDNVFFAQSPDGLSILIPIPDDIRTLRDQIFASSGSLGPQVPGSAQEQMRNEAASIALYNGSSDPGLGTRAADVLRNQGANITQVANADKNYPGTTIVDHTGNPYALKYLVELLGIPQARIQIVFDPTAPAGLELFLGDDVLRSNVFP
jgi:polyisoprenyl-teichoic acid--peptidoglycan teichoic acid transferase